MAGSEKPQTVIQIRPLSEHAEFAEAVRLQKLIWGFADIELLPLRLFVVATRIGGQVLGAFDGDRMVGFCLAIPGMKPGNKSYLHSHMLGVLPEYRNAGVGRLLKLEQRTAALARGIDLIEWTFDPLEVKNAFFNIERLGAIVRRFVLNQYGISTSPLQGGLPTDRCIAEWWIAQPRREGLPIVERISVPAESRSREIQKRVGDAFLEHFSKGLAVVGFERTPEAGTYLLTPWDSK